MHERPGPSAAQASAVATESVAFCQRGALIRRSDARGFSYRFSAAWTDVSGQGAEALIDDRWLEQVHPQDRARLAGIEHEMLSSRLPYTVEFRLHHGRSGYRWVAERGWPVTDAEGGFDGFEHYAVDVQESTVLGEQLAERLSKKRRILKDHAAFAVALASELARLPSARAKIALDIFATLSCTPNRERSHARPVGAWLAAMVDEACAALPAATRPFSLSLPDDALAVDFDPAVLRVAMTNLLVCTTLLSDQAMCAEDCSVRAERVEDTLYVELPAWPGSSALVLLDLALAGRDLPAGQAVEVPDGARRQRVALPLARL